MRGVADEDLQSVVGEDFTFSQVLEIIGGSGFRDGLTGERSLIMAVLEMAIADLTNKHPRNAKKRADARAWFEATYDSSRFPDVKTFEGNCLALGLNPDVLRVVILAMEPRNTRRGPMNHVLDGVRMRRRRTPQIVGIRKGAA